MRIKYAAFALLFTALGCKTPEPEPNVEVDRCEVAARKVSELWGGGEDARALAYKRMITSCTPGPNETLSVHGVALLDCIETAQTGAAVHRCELEFEHAQEQEQNAEKLDAFEDLFRKIYKHVNCGGEAHPADTGALDALELKARAAGVTDETIARVVEKASSEIEAEPCP